MRMRLPRSSGAVVLFADRKHRAGAGEGNRTLVCSLGSCRSAIELRPREAFLSLRHRLGTDLHSWFCTVSTPFGRWTDWPESPISDVPKCSPVFTESPETLIRGARTCMHPVAKRKDLPYESGRSKGWLKIKNPDSPAMQRVRDQTF